MGSSAALAVGGTVGLPAVAQAVPLAAEADGPVLPGNEGDIGVYTDGLKHSMEIGDPVYNNLDEVADQLAPPVAPTAKSMYESIFKADRKGAGTDYYVDRVLGVHGTLGTPILMTRGRTLYMRGASNNNWGILGFAGSTYVGGPNNLGNLYTVTVPGQSITELSDDRFNAPSHASTR